jgi:membrane peptidoglycan carboxypeptidase
MYLNNIYWGNNNYGIQTASETYFKKPASKLNLAESAMLAGMIQAPEDYNPFHQYKAAKERQEVVLDRMQYLGWITPAEAEAAKKTKIILGEPTAWRGSKLPYVTDTVIKEIKDRFGDETLRKGGLRIQTTVDYDIQKTDKMKTSIFYINSNNGYTRFKNKKMIKSKENRLLSFNTDMEHTGSTCTDENVRIVINLNYFL